MERQLERRDGHGMLRQDKARHMSGVIQSKAHESKCIVMLRQSKAHERARASLSKSSMMLRQRKQGL